MLICDGLSVYTETDGEKAGKIFPNHPSSPKEDTPGPQQLKVNVFSMFSFQEGSNENLNGIVCVE